MRRNDEVFLVAWDKPGTRSAPGRFYREIKKLDEVRFIQRSVYKTKTIGGAKRLVELAKRHRLNAVVFRAAEIEVG